MKLTQENKDHIDGLSLTELLRKWRHAPIGDPWIEGETGKYWGERMHALRSEPGGDEAWTRASKSIGW